MARSNFSELDHFEYFLKPIFSSESDKLAKIISLKVYHVFKKLFWVSVVTTLTLFRMGFFGAAHKCEGDQKIPTPKICHTYPVMMEQDDSKTIWFTWHALSVIMRLAFFHRKSANFAIWRNTDTDCILMHNF